VSNPSGNVISSQSRLWYHVIRPMETGAVTWSYRLFGGIFPECPFFRSGLTNATQAASAEPHTTWDIPEWASQAPNGAGKAKMLTLLAAFPVTRLRR